MARVKRGTKRRARRKKYLKRTKGFFRKPRIAPTVTPSATAASRSASTAACGFSASAPPPA